jgi:hypothetical protein
MKAALALLAACASPHADTPANHQPAPPGPLSPFVMIVSPFYSQCGKVHHIQVLVDGAQRATVTTSADCPGPMHQVKPGVFVSDADFGHVDRSPAYDVPAGHHRIEVRDVETKQADAIERDFPVYDDRHRVMKEMAAKLEDGKLTMLGLAFEFIVSPITNE